MNRIKDLVTSDILIDERAKDDINKLSDEDYEKLVESIKKEQPFVVSKEFIKKTFVKDVKIIKIYKRKNTLTIKDFVKTLNEKYSKLQKILIEKLEINNIVSINKSSVGNVTVIGMIKEINEGGNNLDVLVEDPTGEIRTSITKKIGSKISLDDVVAILGNINNKILFVDRIIFPDVPIRPVNYSKESVRVAFITEDMKTDAEYIVTKNQVKDRVKNIDYKIERPAVVEINDIKILIISNPNALSVLKKRYIKMENRDFIIDIIPDILFSETGENRNYKGITIITSGNSVDLKTREVKPVI